MDDEQKQVWETLNTIRTKMAVAESQLERVENHPERMVILEEKLEALDKRLIVLSRAWTSLVLLLTAAVLGLLFDIKELVK